VPRSFALFLICLLASPSVSQAAAPAPLLVTARRHGEACRIIAAGRRVTSDQFTHLAERWPSRRAVFRMQQDTPYRCVGGVIFTLQRFGYQIQLR
jgi:hypothetical protein